MKKTILFSFSLLLLSVLLFSKTNAQDSAYEARNDQPDGTQFVAVYIGAENCGPCHLPENMEAVELMKNKFSMIADDHGWSFKAVGIALDHSTEIGYNFLQKNGEFDEMILGNSWTNIGSELFIFGADDVFPAIPQIVLYKQDVTRNRGLIEFSERYGVQRIMLGELRSWLEDGAKWEAISQSNK